MTSALELIRCRDPHHPLMQQAMTLYRSSFPQHELRLWPDQEDALQEDAYHFEFAMLDGRLAGLILYWTLGDMLYIEHFCVMPALRGRGIGQRILALLARQGRLTVLEIDPPVDALSIRRKGFYERCGYVANPFSHVHPPYQTAYAGHELVLMSHPCAISEAEFDAFTRGLREDVMRFSEGRRGGPSR
ncbi:MAG: GNAT family N-acetyltransferase [Clostridia bacterium]|nr:GNAT family N-acetyltransferase [Clostridia bacterium]